MKPCRKANAPLIVGGLQLLDFDAWLAAHQYPAELREQLPAGKFCRLIELGPLAGCAISQADVDLVDQAIPWTGVRPDYDVPRYWSNRRLSDTDTICALVVSRPSEWDLRNTVLAYGARRPYAMLLRLAGEGDLVAAQTARAALLLSSIVSDLAREAGLEIPAHRTPWSHPVEERKRVSGAGLRTFLNVCDELGISWNQRRSFLAKPLSFEFDDWCEAARAHADFVMPEGALLGISAMLGVYAALKQIHLVPSAMAAWINGNEPEPPFAGRPLDFMRKGLDEMLETRRWLEAKLNALPS